MPLAYCVKCKSKTEQEDAKMVVNGTEAVGLGAIAGGMQFAAIYPMSPISNILQVLALYQEKCEYPMGI
jgi:2-oxoglutarate ferredoxin oxidoreductase subunit alpha